MVDRGYGKGCLALAKYVTLSLKAMPSALHCRSKNPCSRLRRRRIRPCVPEERSRATKQTSLGLKAGRGQCVCAYLGVCTIRLQVCVQPLTPIWNTVDAPHPPQLPVGEHDDATTTTGVIVAMEKTGLKVVSNRREFSYRAALLRTTCVVAAAGPARVCRSPQRPGRHCREHSLPGTKSHPSRGSVIANRQGGAATWVLSRAPRARGEPLGASSGSGAASDSGAA